MDMNQHIITMQMEFLSKIHKNYMFSIKIIYIFQ
jgi:hypothetical protein